MAKRTCMEAALAKLNYRMRTGAELRKALKEFGYDDQEIKETVEELLYFGYLDDRRYAAEFFRASRRKNWSISRISRALREKGVSPDDISAALKEQEDPENAGETELSWDDRETALRVGMKMASEQLNRSRSIDDAFLGKVGRRLTTLGYDAGCCYYVMNRIREKAAETVKEDEY